MEIKLKQSVYDEDNWPIGTDFLTKSFYVYLMTEAMKELPKGGDDYVDLDIPTKDIHRSQKLPLAKIRVLTTRLEQHQKIKRIGGRYRIFNVNEFRVRQPYLKTKAKKK